MKKVVQHICLVSDHILPNLIPILEKKPEFVHLVVSAEKSHVGKRFTQILENLNINYKIYPNAPVSNVQEIYFFAENVLNQIISCLNNESLVFNATAGTKPMAMAFSNIIQQYPNAKIIYTNTYHSLLEYLHPIGHPPDHLPGVLDVKTYLSAQNIQLKFCDSDDIVWQKDVFSRAELTFLMAKKAGFNGHLFGILNALSQKACNRSSDMLVDPCQEFDRPVHNKYWQQILTSMANQELIEWDELSKVQFNTIEAANYIGGGWLEEYAWLIAKNNNVDDVRLGVNVKTCDGNRCHVPNEHDVIIVHNNRLLHIECKTVNYQKFSYLGKDLSYKMDSTGAKIGGLFGNNVLLSVWNLPSHQLERANTYGIDVLAAQKLDSFDVFLKDWIASS